MVYKNPEIPAWLIWVVWVMASAAGVIVVIGGAFIALTGMPELNGTQWFIYFALPAFSLMIPLLQWLAAKEYLPPLGFWVGSSFLGGLIGALITSFLSDFAYAVLPWRTATVLLVATFWLCLGAAQCLMLCTTYRKFGMWTLVNLLGGIAFGLIVSQSMASPLELIFLGSLPALFTGLGLIVLIQRFDAHQLQTQPS